MLPLVSINKIRLPVAASDFLVLIFNNCDIFPHEKIASSSQISTVASAFPFAEGGKEKKAPRNLVGRAIS